MTDERREAIELGERAKELLEDETLQLAFDHLKAKFTQAWANTTLEDREGREKLYLARQGIEYAERELRILLDNGKIAASEIEKEEKRHGAENQ